MRTLSLTVCTLGLSVSVAAQAAEDISEVVRTKCKGCHGLDGKAQTKTGKEENMDDLSNPRWHSAHTDDDIRHAITHGVPKTKMKGFKEKLTAGQIEALVKWVRGLKVPATP